MLVLGRGNVTLRRNGPLSLTALRPAEPTIHNSFKYDDEQTEYMLDSLVTAQQCLRPDTVFCAVDIRCVLQHQTKQFALRSAKVAWKPLPRSVILSLPGAGPFLTLECKPVTGKESVSICDSLTGLGMGITRDRCLDSDRGIKVSSSSVCTSGHDSSQGFPMCQDTSTPFQNTAGLYITSDASGLGFCQGRAVANLHIPSDLCASDVRVWKPGRALFIPSVSLAMFCPCRKTRFCGIIQLHGCHITSIQ